MRSPEYPGNWGTRREQVVHTFYDRPQYASVTARFEERVQENLRNRIANVIYMDEYDSEMLKYDHATHYSYDIHDNVKELLQEDRSLAAYGDDYAFHSIRYDYDLVSGNVNQVHYQNAENDQKDWFSMFYEYDSENRIQKVKSQFPNDEQPKQNASYEYYRHGPLARTVLGDGVQDMTNLYTGNISRMATALANTEIGGNFGTQVRDFRYDVLNRLKSSKVINSKNTADAYATAYTYDANGNITGLTRNNANGKQFDNLTYRYEQDAEGNFINNRLLHVND